MSVVVDQSKRFWKLICASFWDPPRSDNKQAQIDLSSSTIRRVQIPYRTRTDKNNADFLKHLPIGLLRVVNSFVRGYVRRCSGFIANRGLLSPLSQVEDIQ